MPSKNLSKKHLVIVSLIACGLLAASGLLMVVSPEWSVPVLLTASLGTIVAFQLVTMNDMRHELRRVVAHNSDWLRRQTEAYFQIYSTIHPRIPLPNLDTWAISPHTAAHLVRMVKTRRPALVLELGSGSSTLITAYCLEENGAGRVVSVDHDQHYAEQTRRQLEEHGLAGTAQVIHAPLAPLEAARTSGVWYDLNASDMVKSMAPGSVDMILVDGPPNELQTYARYPAVFALIDLLRPKGFFLVDDYDVPDVKAWVAAAVRNYDLKVESVSADDSSVVLEKN